MIFTIKAHLLIELSLIVMKTEEGYQCLSENKLASYSGYMLSLHELFKN